MQLTERIQIERGSSQHNPRGCVGPRGAFWEGGVGIVMLQEEEEEEVADSGVMNEAIKLKRQS